MGTRHEDRVGPADGGGRLVPVIGRRAGPALAPSGVSQRAGAGGAARLRRQAIRSGSV